MYLGIDIGTSSVKVVLIDANQRVIGTRSEPLTVDRPRPGWSEQDPQSWVEATSNCIDALARAHGEAVAALRGIGLSGQMHGATLLDHADRPLRPCMLWNDGRAGEEAAALDADPRFRAVTGNIVFAGFTAPKLAWVAKHEPKIFGDICKVLLPKDFVRLWLSGDSATDMSDASGTSWLDVAGRDWSDDLLAATHLDRARMPALHEGTAPTGHLRPLLASRWHIRQRVIIAAGAGDNAASACGVGVVRPGNAFLSLGTSGVLFAATDSFRPNPDSAVHAFCHALPGTWHQMGVMLSAAAALDWLAEVVSVPAAKLAEAVADTPSGPGPVLFLPYLAGERTPLNDPAARGVFTGLGAETGTADLARAVMEGVGYGFADSRDALAAAGVRVERATALGGGSRSRAWLQIIADILGISIEVPADGDFGAAFGAARLGLIAAEKADPVTICTAPAIRETIEPDPARTQAFADAHRRYRALHPAITEAMRA